ncbi:MAG TPA: ABC transporter substrate-binding protein, partial [Solirubrobacteraceae bacterium]
QLRAETARHPSRERLAELLMLALYRSGRQTEALDVYRAVHAHLTGELGLEPGPALRELQARILRHDPELRAPGRSAPAGPDAPRRAPTAVPDAPATAGRRRHARTVPLGLAAVLAAVLAAIVVVIVGEGAGNSTVERTLRAPALGVFDLRSGRPSGAIALGAVATRITAGLGADWATSYDNGTLLRISPRDDAIVQTVRVGVGASGVATDAGDVWVADTLEDRVTRVSAATDQVIQQIPVGNGPSDVAAGAGAVWVANRGSGTVSRIDPLTGSVLGVTPVGTSPAGLAVGDGAVWVALSGADAVAQLNPQTGQLQQTIPVGSGPSAVTVGRAGVWVANELDSTVSLIDPSNDSVVLTRAVQGAPDALAPTGNGVWIAGSAPQLTLLSAAGQTRTLTIPSPTAALAASSGRLLVAVRGTGVAHRGGTLIVRVSDPLPDIDPSACCSVPPNMTALSYDALLAFSKSPESPDTLVPDLALSIPRPEDGGLSYTFHLRPGLRYWNGTPVRASDFLRGLERAAQASSTWDAYLTALPGALACPYARRCDLSSAVVANDRAGTVTLRLSRPDPGLLAALGQPAFAPAPPGSGPRPGTGPYRIARFVPNELIEYTRNPYFHEWAPAAQPAGYPDQIVVHMNGTPASDVQAVLRGRADYTFDTPSAGQLRRIQLLSPGLLHTEPLPDTDFLDLNARRAPFNDVHVRRALNYAINRNTIVNLYGGPDSATPTCQIIPATIPGHVPYCPYTRDPSPNGRWSAPDLVRARQLVAQSGTRGETVTLLTANQSGPWGEPVGKYVVEVLRQLGYRARLRVVTPNEWSAAMIDYHHPPQIDTNSWDADVPSPSDWITIQLSCGEWRPPTQLVNHAEFCDPAIDQLATRAAGLELTDPLAANRLWALADREITNLAPWLPTVTETETDLVSSRVGDYQYVPTIFALLDQLWVH